MKTTSRALDFASRWFDAATVDRVFAPLIADWQREWSEASGLRRWSALARGLAAFISAVLISSPRLLGQPTPWTVSTRMVARIAIFVMIATALLTVPFAFQTPAVWPFLLFLIPSTLAIVFPFAMIAAVDAIRCDHALPSHIERATALKLATASLLFMIVFGGFVVPAANQAFREASYRGALGADSSNEQRIAGRPLPRGLRAAMHLVRIRRLGVPQETRDAFVLLEQAQLLDADLAGRLKKMVGFRNVAIHDYQKLNLEIVRRIVTEHLDDFLAFCRLLLRL